VVPLSSTPINELGTPLNLHVVGDDDADDNEVSYKKAEFDRFQLRPSDPQAQDTVQQQVRLLPGETPPPTARLYEMYNLEEIDAIRKGVTPQLAREEPTVHDRAEQPGVWDPADILRSYQRYLRLWPLTWHTYEAPDFKAWKDH